MPKLSVCIPVYNCQDYIGEAIDSVLKQDYKDLELLIVDNRSTDATLEVVSKYADPRIRVVQNDTNIGMVGNWNRVVELASGEYIKVLPADDFLYPGCLSKQCAVLDADKTRSIALVCGRKRIIDSKGKPLFTRGFSRSAGAFTSANAVNRAVRSGGNIIGEPGVVMFRKETIIKAGPFTAGIYYVMDLDMWMRLLLHGGLYSLPDVLCAFRISGVSESLKQIATQRRDIDNFFKKIKDDPAYHLTTTSYWIGLFNSFLSAQAKKLVYGVAIKKQ